MLFETEIMRETRHASHSMLQTVADLPSVAHDYHSELVIYLLHLGYLYKGPYIVNVTDIVNNFFLIAKNGSN